MTETTIKQQLQHILDSGVGRWNYDELVGEIYESFHNIDQAHSLLNQLEEKISAEGNKADPQLLERTGIFAFAQGEFNKAEHYLRPVEKRPESAHFLGRVLAQKERFEDALEALERGKEGDEDFESDRFIIEVLCAMRQPERAQEICDFYRAAHSESPDWLFCMGWTKEIEGEYAEAIDLYENALSRDENHHNSLFRLAYNCDLNGDDQRAIELYEKCASLQPTSLGALMNLGILYEDHGEYEKAIDCYERVLAVDPAHKRARLYLKDADASLHMTVDEKFPLLSTKQDMVLEKNLDSFDLSTRCRHVLEKMEVQTLGDLTDITETELLEWNNFGQSSLRELKNLLQRHGLSLKEEPAQISENNEQGET